MKNTKTNNENAFFTKKEAADYLQVSPATIHNWIKTNKIKADAYQSKQPCFLRENIYKLRERLLSGEDSSLKSRRNKIYSTGKTAYTAYLKKGSKNKAFFNLLFETLENETLSSGDINNIIAQCAIKLYSGNNLHTLNLLLNDLTYGNIDADNHLISDTSSKSLYYNICHLLCDEKSTLTYDRNEDILGLIYSSLRQLKSRKNSGAYYTPLDIARKMNKVMFPCEADFCKISQGKSGFCKISQGESDFCKISPGESGFCKKILDPACGSGSFLLTLPEFIPFDCIYGNDIDKTSIAIIRINFFLRDDSLSYEQLCSHFSCSDFLKSSNCSKYDYIVGNPPWGSNIDSAYLNSLTPTLECASKKGADSFELFVEKSIRKLSDTGAFGLLIPHSFINVKSHEKIREILLDMGYFCYFCNLNDAFSGVACPGIFVIWSRRKPQNMTITYNNEETNVAYNNTCERTFTKDFMPVFISDSDYKKLDMLINSPNICYLKNNATFGLGIVTGNNKKLLIPAEKNPKIINPGSKNSIMLHPDRESNEQLLPILKGTNITRYKISEPEYLIKYDRNTLQQAAELSLYQCPQKLVYRFINKRLAFALDTNRTLTLNSCNFLIPQIDFLSIKYILAVLNSATSQFIFENKFSSVKVLRSHIEQLPIPLADKEKQQEISHYVDLISCCDNESEFQKYDRIINNLVERLF